jgi:hypothetical protein
MKRICTVLCLLIASPGSRAAEATAGRPSAWSWERFPKADRIQVAQVPALAGPARTEPVRAPTAGRVRIASHGPSDAVLAEGAEWGRIEPIETNAEEEAIRSLEADLKAREERYREFEKSGVLAQIQKEIRSAKDALALAEAAEKDPKLFKGERPLLDPSSRPALTAEECRAALGSLENRRERLAGGDPSVDPPDLQTMRGELRRRRSRYEEQQKQLVLRQPFAGSLLLADTHDGRFVSAGEVVALAVSRERLSIRLKANTPLLNAAAPEQLEATITLPSGRTITAPYASAGFDPAAEGTTVLRFEAAVPAEVMKGIHSAGIQLAAGVFLKLGEWCVIVPKLLVAREDKDDLTTAGWREAIPRLFPGAELRAEGRTHLAVLPVKAP